ncbi:MAG: TIGR01212 family radical SAM protein [Planctomycetaceae bacterium]
MPKESDLSVMNAAQVSSAGPRPRFRSFGTALRDRFGGRIQRISLDAGFTCPNVDGTVAKGGCNFCDNRSFSPSRRVRLAAVADQLSRGMTSLRRRYKHVAGFIAYFQPATNTYAPVEQLEEIYRLAIGFSPEIVGLAIGTRPDCVPDVVLDLVDQLASETYVSLEYGMQTRHDASLTWMNRAHRHAHMIDAMNRSRGRRFETCAHIILGIPGETPEQMLHTAKSIGMLGVDAVKIHNLYAVRGTSLGEEVLSGRIRMMERPDYVRTLIEFLRQIPERVVVERINGDAPPDYLIAPQWCLEKSRLLKEIEDEMVRLNAYQGDRYDPTWRDDPIEPAITPQTIEARIGQQGRLPVLRVASQTATPTA